MKNIMKLWKMFHINQSVLNIKDDSIDKWRISIKEKCKVYSLFNVIIHNGSNGNFHFATKRGYLI